MRQQRARDRGEVRIVAAEQDLGRHRLGDLHQAAARAEHQRQRDPNLRLGQLVRAQQPVGERGLAERQDLVQIAAAAGAAGGLRAVDRHRRPAFPHAAPHSAAVAVGPAQRRSSATRPCASSCFR